MIDLHCHLLPGIDDGPATTQEAVEMARVAVAGGITQIVCTPHVNHSYPANTAATIAQAVDTLRADLAAAGVPLQISAGAEVALSKALELSDDELTALHLDRSGTLLLELSIGSAVPRAGSLVRSLQARGHRILLAHPERCLTFHQEPQLVGELVQAGCLTQLTAGSLAGDFGRTVRRVAQKIVSDGHAHIIASDAHDPAHRAPLLAQPLAGADLTALLEPACATGPATLLADGPVAACAATQRAGGLRGLFGR